MGTDHDRLARKPPDEHSGFASIRKTKRPRSRTGSTGDRETPASRGIVTSTADRRGKSVQDLAVPAPNLGRFAAQAFRHMRIERFGAALADAQQLVRKHLLQAVLVGVGLGYLLSRTTVR